MLRIFHNTTYDFIKPWRIMVVITAAFISLGLILLAVSKVRTGDAVQYSIDFIGGTSVQVHFNQPPDVGNLRSALDAGGVPDANIQSFGSNRDFTIRARGAGTNAEAEASAPGAEQTASRINGILTQKFGAGNFRIDRTDSVGPRVGSDLQRGAILAILLSFLLTLAYLAIRFEWRFGLAAVRT